MSLLTAILSTASITLAVEIRFADRVSIHPSEPTEVTLTGNKLRAESGETAKLWTSFPADVEPVDKNSKDRNVVRYKITPKQRIGGLVALRAFDQDSISQALLFSVDSLPNSRLPAPNDPPVAIPAVFDCSSQGLGHRSIAFECKQGQSFVAEIVGARIGSEIDGLLVLQDSDHKELAFADDHAITGSDPILRWTATYDGVHHLVFRDVEYRGGLRMQVRITDQSTAAVCFPNAVRFGETRPIEQTLLASVASDQAESTPAVAKAVSAQGLTFLQQSSVIAPLAQTDLPIYAERADAKNRVPVPAVFCGRIEAGEEHDAVFFPSRKGEEITVGFLPNSLPFVGVVQLMHDGKQIAQHHWGSDPKGRLRHKLTQDGVCELRIRDAIGRSGLGYEYAMSIRSANMPAILRISRARKNKKRRNDILHRQVWHAPEPLSVFVHCDRRGYSGACSVVAELNGQACRVVGTIEAKQGETEIDIHLPEPFAKEATGEEAKPVVASLKLYGRGTIDGHAVSIPLDLSEHTKRDFPSFGVTPSIVGSQIAVLIKPSAKEKKK